MEKILCLILVLTFNGCATMGFNAKSRAEIATQAVVIKQDGSEIMEPLQKYVFDQHKMGNNGTVSAEQTYQEQDALKTALEAAQTILLAYAASDTPISENVVVAITDMIVNASEKDSQSIPATQNFTMTWAADADALANAIKGDQQNLSETIGLVNTLGALIVSQLMVPSMPPVPVPQLNEPDPLIVELEKLLRK